MVEPEFLLDANIIVCAIDGNPAALRTRLEQQAVGSLVTSTVCVAEVMVGLKADQEGAWSGLRTLLAVVKPLPFDAEAAEYFATIPFKRGKFDRLIAAQALSRDLAIVTNNERDFADVPGLKVENWTE